MNERKIRLAIVGTGFGKSVQIPGFRACPNAEVYAICASTLEKAKAVQQEFGIPHAFANYKAMLRLQELDLVSITTPPHLHFPMTIAALRAGKHVLCEKPMAMNLHEARQMWRRAKHSNLVCLIDHELRFNPARRHIKQLISEGFIGRLRHVQISLTLSYRSTSEMRSWDWWSDKKRGGGILGAVGSHQIDLLRWWFGEIIEARGHLETFIKTRPMPESLEPRRVTTDDFCCFWLKFANGGLGSVQLSLVARHASQARLEIYGDQGSIVLSDEKLFAGHHKETLAEVTDLEPLPVVPGMPEGVFPRSFALLSQYVIEYLSQGKRPAIGATFYDGMRCQAVMDAVRKSDRSGRWVKIK